MIYFSLPIPQPFSFCAQSHANSRRFKCPQMNVSRANCNKIIMLFTDGGEEKAEEIFKDSNPDKAVAPHSGQQRAPSSFLSPLSRPAAANFHVSPLADRCASLRFPLASTTTTKIQSSRWPAPTKVNVFEIPCCS